MPNYWVANGVLPCGDAYNMSVTCDPTVQYTGPESCANKWTATANISCVNGLNITGIAVACQCDAPPLWSFDGDTSNCNCCTPPPTTTPTPTPTNNCSLASPSTLNANCVCFVNSQFSNLSAEELLKIQTSIGDGSFVTVNLSWIEPPNVDYDGRAYGSQACMLGYQIQALDIRGESGSGLSGGIVDNVCIFNNRARSYQYYMNSQKIYRGDGTCTDFSNDNRGLKFRIRSIHFGNCQQAYFDSWADPQFASSIPSAWVEFPGEYCFNSCCVTPTPTPTMTMTPSVTASPTITPSVTVSVSVSPSLSVSASSTPAPTPSNTPDPTPSNTPDPTPSNTPDPTPSKTPDPTPDPTPPPSYDAYIQSIINQSINFIP